MVAEVKGMLGTVVLGDEGAEDADAGRSKDVVDLCGSVDADATVVVPGVEGAFVGCSLHVGVEDGEGGVVGDDVIGGIAHVDVEVACQDEGRLVV